MSLNNFHIRFNIFFFGLEKYTSMRTFVVGSTFLCRNRMTPLEWTKPGSEMMVWCFDGIDVNESSGSNLPIGWDIHEVNYQ